MQIPKYSLGTGDRFGKEGTAQLAAVQRARNEGVDVAIVWNKSWREHKLIGTNPEAVSNEADNAASAANWPTDYYFVDADHINASNVDGHGGIGSFIEASDFFTLDVADAIGQRAPEEVLTDFVARYEHLTRAPIEISRLSEPLVLDGPQLAAIGEKYLGAVREAAGIYQKISRSKDSSSFVVEVSMDETDSAQSPLELLLILAELAHLEVPAQTIAPKFTGEFYKAENDFF